MLSPGDVIHVFCIFITPQKHKYAVCVCQNTKLFFFINTEPRRSRPGVQLPVTKRDLPFLQWDSYIDTGALYKFRAIELSASQLVGQLPDALKLEITKMVSAHGYLTEIQKQIVLNNFGRLSSEEAGP
jgi:hypothetical protein